MVRIFEVAELAERKRLLRVQSDLYRRMLVVEAANIKYSVERIRRKYAFVKYLLGFMGAGASVAGIWSAFGATQKKREGGLLSRLFSSVQFINFARGIISKFKTGQGDSEPMDD